MSTITQTFTANSTWVAPSNAAIVSAFIVGGGGGGGGGNSANGGGNGGNGGQVRQINNISVTAGTSYVITVGTGGAGGGINGNGTAGNPSSAIGQTATGGGGGLSRSGVSGAGGSGGTSGQTTGTNIGGNGGSGAIFRSAAYGAGGGGGCGVYNRNSAFPIRGGESPGPGIPSAGDGGGDSTAAQSGEGNSGRGGGGGRSFGETSQRSGAAYVTRGAGGGATGGSGIVILTWEEATYELSLVRSSANTSQTGFDESGTVTIQLKTTNVANGVTVPYSIAGAGITAADFSPATLTGSFTISSTDSGATGTSTITLALSADSLTETPEETATLSLNNGFASLSFNIGDSSRPALTDVDGIIIRVSDYNNLRTKVINLLGTGAGNSGYGQLVRSSAVNENTRVSIVEWDNLRYDIFNVWKHQFGILPTISDVRNPLDNEGRDAGALVKANSTTAPYDQYDNFANILVANRFGIHSSQAITRNGLTPDAPWIVSFDSSWTAKLICTVTVSWPTADAARFFFNTGGEIRFNSARTNGAVNPQNNSWTTLLTSAGILSFGGQLPRAGFSPANGTNYYRLNSTPNIWATKTASSPYGANDFTIKASTADTIGAVRTITFLVEWTDGHVGISGPDTVDGTVTLAITTLEASGNLEPAGSGTFTVTSPTVSFTPITLG